MNTFRDLEAFQNVLGSAYKQGAGAAGRDALAQAFEGWGYSREQATQYASVVLSKNDEGSARRAAQNAIELLGSWVRGTMQGGGTAWLKTTQETWEFRADLTYYYKQQSYEGGSTGAWPNFQASYSKPSSSVEFGVWGPGDCRETSGILYLTTISEEGRVRRLVHRWTDNGPYHRGCSINGEPFGRQL